MGQTILVDEQDKWLLEKYIWHFDGHYIQRYVFLNPKKYTTALLHREIMEAKKGQIIDHIDGNPFNNQRANLRFVTYQQNSMNRHKINTKSGYKGVYLHKPSNCFYAQIMINRKGIHLGMFKDPELAAKAYDLAARKYFGEYAKTNFERSI